LQEQRYVVFRHVGGSHYSGLWQDRQVAESPCSDLVFSYYNNSKTMANSNVLQVILRDHGFHRVEMPGDDWNIFWCAGQVDPLQLRHLKPHQKVNKFPKASSLTLKSNLWANFLRMQNRFGQNHFDFMPKTFILPVQFDQWQEWVSREENQNTLWIVKPAAAYCGRGITLHDPRNGIQEQLRQQKGVACTYIDPPFLLNGLKSDIRVYVLVSSWHPLTVYLYDEGLARFATEKYSLESLEQRCCHLTNYSLNKHNKAFVHSEEDDAGSKWSLSAFKLRLIEQLGQTRADEVWRRVDDIVVKTAIAVEPLMSEALRTFLPSAAEDRPNTQCFQLFGFDVMLDAEARPWLLEVNLDPALRTESPLDLKVKSRMLLDLLNLVGVPVPTNAGAHGLDSSSHEGAAVEGIEPAFVATVQQREEMLSHVNSEFQRSKLGGWRRLFPSKRSSEYFSFLDPGRQLHHLPFDV